MRHLVLALGQEGIEHALVLAGGEQTPLDAQLVHGIDEAEAVHAYADGADDAAGIGIDAVGRHRGVVAAGGADVGDHGVEGLVRVLLAQAPDGAVDVGRLHRAAAGAVDAQDHAHALLRLEGVLQALYHIVGAGLGIVGDDALEVHHRHMRLHLGQVDVAVVEHDGQQGEQVGKAQQLEEDAPAPAAPLLHQSLARQPLDGLAFPARLLFLAHRGSRVRRSVPARASQRGISCMSSTSPAGSCSSRASAGCTPQPTARASMPAAWAIKIS